MSHTELLRAIPLLRGVSIDELDALPFQRVERDTGEEFFRQGDPGDAAYGVLTGRVKISKQSPRGRDVILEIIAAGELFAAVAVLRSIPMPATAVALEPTACLKIAAGPFHALITRHPEIATKMLETVSRRLLEANTSRLELATEPVEVRLARALLHLGKRFGSPRGDEVVFTQALTRQNLADLAGTTVESAIRALSRWTKDGLLRTDAGRLTIVAPEELRRLAGDEGD